jgi:hypothetical protein
MSKSADARATDPQEQAAPGQAREEARQRAVRDDVKRPETAGTAGTHGTNPAGLDTRQRLEMPEMRFVKFDHDQSKIVAKDRNGSTFYFGVGAATAYGHVNSANWSQRASPSMFVADETVTAIVDRTQPTVLLTLLDAATASRLMQPRTMDNKSLSCLVRRVDGRTLGVALPHHGDPFAFDIELASDWQMIDEQSQPMSARRSREVLNAKVGVPARIDVWVRWDASRCLYVARFLGEGLSLLAYAIDFENEWNKVIVESVDDGRSTAVIDMRSTAIGKRTVSFPTGLADAMKAAAADRRWRDLSLTPLAPNEQADCRRVAAVR